MNALLDHVWGESLAVDYLWAQVTGMRPAAAVAQPFLVLQAFIDDSRSRDGTFFVLAGAIASAEAWAKFTVDWEEILPLAPLDENGQRNFSFYEILRSGDEKVQNFPAFAKVISQHIRCSIALLMNVDDLVRAQNRIETPETHIEWGDYGNPYLFAFVAFLECFHNQRSIFADIIKPAEDVEIIFDNQSEKRLIYKAWDKFLEAQAPGAEVERLGKEPPRFLDDKKFLALQGADFIAGWCRYCFERGINPAKGFVKIRNVEIENKFTPMIVMDMTEDHIAKYFLAMIRRNLPPGKMAFDTKYPSS